MRRRRSERTFLQLFMSYWLPVLLYIAVVLVLSAQPNLQPPLKFENSDKVYHLIEYFGLGILLVRAVRAWLPGPSALSVSLVALCAGIVVGTGDELLQSTVSGRMCSGFDLLADTVGVAIAQLAYLMAAAR